MSARVHKWKAAAPKGWRCTKCKNAFASYVCTMFDATGFACNEGFLATARCEACYLEETKAKTKTKVGASDAEAAARDEALDRLEERRSGLVAVAAQIAREICGLRGCVSSTDVWEELRRRAENDPVLQLALTDADPRWMGVVFRSNKEWRRIAWESSGSHKRPVAVWAFNV